MPFRLLHSSHPLAQVTGGLPEDTPEAPEVPLIQGREIRGGPQMLQLRWGGCFGWGWRAGTQPQQAALAAAGLAASGPPSSAHRG